MSRGLRIAPADAPVTGYMFGKGVYFADCASKSANYCHASNEQPYGLLEWDLFIRLIRFFACVINPLFYFGSKFSALFSLGLCLLKIMNNPNKAPVQSCTRERKRGLRCRRNVTKVAWKI